MQKHLNPASKSYRLQSVTKIPEDMLQQYGGKLLEMAM